MNELNANKNLSLSYMKLTKTQQKILNYYKFNINNFDTQFIKDSGYDNKTDFFNNIKEQYKKDIKEDRAEKRRKKYSVTFKYDVTLLKGTKYEKVKRSITRILTSKQKALKNRNELISGLDSAMASGHGEGSGYVEEYTNLKMEKPILLTPQNKKELMNIKMQNIMIEDERVKYNKNGFLMSDIDKKNNMCVVDYLIYKYNNPDNADNKRIKKLTVEKIKKLAFHCEDGDTSQFDLKEGLNVNQISAIMKFIRCAFIAVNFDLKEFYKWKPEDSGLNKNKNINFTMIFMVQNRHFYPIEDDEIRNNIMRQAYNYSTVTNKIEEIHEKVKIENVINEKNIIINPDINEIDDIKKGIIILNDTADSMDYLCDMLRSDMTLRNKDLHCDNNGLKQIKISKDLIIYTNPDYERIKKNADIMMEYLKIKAFRDEELLKYVNIENKSLTSIALYFFNDNFKLKKSSCNQQIKNIFNSELCKIKAFRDTFKIPQNKNNIVSIDKNKSYIHALYTNKYDFPVFTTYDTVEIYDDKGYDRPGLYFITTDNYFPLVKNHWYNSSALQQASERNIKFEVKFQVIASDIIKYDYFKNFIDLLKKECKDDYKILLNSFIGCLNKVKKDSYEVNFSTDYKQVCDYFFNNENITVKTELINDDDILYICKKKQTQIFEEHSQPIYNQILLNAHFDLYDKWREVGGDLIQIKTDCLVIENAKQIIPNLNFGGYKYEPRPTHYKINFFTGYNALYKHDIKKWKICNEWRNGINNNESLFLNGLAGTGKSYTIGKICEYLDDKNLSYIKLAPTNKSALNINGVTIHKAFGIQDNKSLNKKIQRLGRYNYIIVDEYSMITLDLYNMFIILKAKYKNVKFIFAGDCNQLPPIEEVERNYENSRLLMELCGFNQIKLTKNMRSDSILFDVHTRLLNGEDVKNDFKKNKLCRKNICYFNKTVDKVNNLWMTKESENTDEEDILRIGDMFLTINAPLICKKNNKKLKLYNNGEYTLSDFDDKKIYIQDNNNNENEEIEITYKDFEEFIRPGYAVTAHCAQGATIHEEYAIYDYDSTRSTKNWRYVALSRATNKNNIYINTLYKKNC